MPPGRGLAGRPGRLRPGRRRLRSARLEELRLAATEARIDADLALGRHDALTAELEQLAAGHPVRERLHGQLMLALYRSGRQADALAAYGRVRGLLAGELGIDPGEPLRRLHASVLAHDPALDWPGDREDAADGHHGAEDTGPVWVANSLDLTVSKLDPATGTVTHTVNVGDGPSSIVAAGNSLWVSDEFGATLDRIDLRTAQVVRTFHLGSSPRGMAVAGSGVWVAARPFPSASHRGGTLTVADTFLPDPSEDPPDPAVEYPADGTLTAAYDGLTAFRRSGGVAGLTLVPDLATTLPRPTAGGTTYTFTLRRGIRYSNGNLVRASDFRRGIQRQLSFGATPDYYKGILGGSACIKHPNRCDLSAGIVTDDAAGRITFRLVQADPDFLYKLGLLLAVPAPPGTILRSTRWPARRWPRKLPIPPRPGGCGPRPITSSPTRHPTSRSTTEALPDSSHPGSGTTRHPRCMDCWSTRCGFGNRHSREPFVPCRRAVSPAGFRLESGFLPNRGVFDKSHNHPARSAPRLVIEAAFQL